MTLPSGAAGARDCRGKPFIVFGDGTETACKPISERDLASFIADCLEEERLRNRVLPIGGPGDALTPRDQGALLFELTGMDQGELARPARFELATPAFGGQYSIQLSYGRVVGGILPVPCRDTSPIVRRQLTQ